MSGPALIRRSLLVCALLFASGRAHAQDWTFDARDIALGGLGSNHDIATEMIADERPYRTIVLPFGLVQVIGHWEVFDPDSPRFDPARAVEYAASPIHYIVGRDTRSTTGRFITDIRNATLDRDLNAYQGVTLPTSLHADGLVSPRWGGTIKIREASDGTFQGLYVGAGPYFAMGSQSAVDPQLVDILSNTAPVFVPNSQMAITSHAQEQIAAAITGGYRARWHLREDAGSPRDGLYVGANINYLHGFEFDDYALAIRLATDRAGLLVPIASPLAFTRMRSTSGRGFAIDLGVGAVVDRWEVGFGANGIANRINWSDVTPTMFSLANLFGGNSTLGEATATSVGTMRLELPIEYRGNVGYVADRWSARADVGHGLLGTTVHGGVEWQVGRSKAALKGPPHIDKSRPPHIDRSRPPRIAVRGGVRYSFEQWNPTGGLGFNITDRVGLDVAAFGTSANLERKRQLALAASIHFTRR
jgi:hypothetical protein